MSTDQPAEVSRLSKFDVTDMLGEHELADHGVAFQDIRVVHLPDEPHSLSVAINGDKGELSKAEVVGPVDTRGRRPRVDEGETYTHIKYVIEPPMVVSRDLGAEALNGVLNTVAVTLARRTMGVIAAAESEAGGPAYSADLMFKIDGDDLAGPPPPSESEPSKI